jgi:hypothetical protein
MLSKGFEMQARRKSDRLNTPIYPRTQRIMIADEGYYYKTREGETRGSFDSEANALKDLKVFIRVMAIEAALDNSDLLKELA